MPPVLSLVAVTVIALALVVLSRPRVEAAPQGVVLDEHFRGAWPNDPQGTAWFVQDGYRLHARETGKFVAVRAPLANVPPDIEVSGVFHKVGGPPGGGYGLILRAQAVGAGDGHDQSGDFVVAAAGDRGEIGVWHRAGNQWLDLVPWTMNGAVRRGSASNELAAQVVNERLAFYVNGSLVADVPVKLRQGGVGVYVGGDQNDVVLDRLHVRAASPAVAAPRGSSAAAGHPARDILAARGGGRAEDADRRSLFELMGRLSTHVFGLFEMFANGFEDPNGPVNNSTALNEAGRRLDAATRTAHELAGEVFGLWRRFGFDGR